MKKIRGCFMAAVATIMLLSVVLYEAADVQAMMSVKVGTYGYKYYTSDMNKVVLEVEGTISENQKCYVYEQIEVQEEETTTTSSEEATTRGSEEATTRGSEETTTKGSEETTTRGDEEATETSEAESTTAARKKNRDMKAVGTFDIVDGKVEIQYSWQAAGNPNVLYIVFSENEAEVRECVTYGELAMEQENRVYTAEGTSITLEKIEVIYTDVNIVINEDTIPEQWVNGSVAVEFTLENALPNLQLSDIHAAIVNNENARVIVTEKAGTEELEGAPIYVAAVSNMEDAPGIIDNLLEISIYDSKVKTVQSSKPIRLDNVAPVSEEITFRKLSAGTEGIVKNGDMFQVSMRAEDTASGIDKNKVLLKLAGAKSVYMCCEEEVYSYTFTVDNTAENDTLAEGIIVGQENNTFVIEKIVLADNAGNETEVYQNQSTQIKYYQPIEDSLTFQVAAVNKDGSAVSLITGADGIAYGTVNQNSQIAAEFTAAHPVSIQYAQENTQLRELAFEESAESGIYRYRAVYQVPEDMNELKDLDIIQLNYRVTDAADNTEVTCFSADIDRQYQYYEEIQVKDISFTSNNAKSGTHAKNGDTITIRFQTSHAVHIDVAQIAGVDITLTSDANAGLIWEGSYTISGRELQDNSIVGLKLVVTDASGNRYELESEAVEKILYLAPLTITSLDMVSSNANSAVAKKGDTITVTFTASHEVESIDVLTIAGVQAAASSSDGINWTAVYQIAEGDIQDGEIVRLMLKISDAAGNESEEMNESSCSSGSITYYAPIIIERITVFSDNTRNTDLYCKDGDTVSVTFHSNHAIKVHDARIAGHGANSAGRSSGGTGAEEWTLTYTIQNGDLNDMEHILFAFGVDDVAGNGVIVFDQTTQGVVNTLIYMAPVHVEDIIKSNNENAAFAKNGSTITITLKANHKVSCEEITIQGRNADGTDQTAEELTVAYTIPADEAGMREGEISYHYRISDAAGNEADVQSEGSQDSTSVIYDRSRPLTELTPNHISFSGKTMTYQARFTDTYLKPSAMSVKVNGQERVTAEDIAAAGSAAGKLYTKKIELSIDGNYTLSAKTADEAGNVSEEEQSSVIIDTTNPAVQTINIDIGNPKVYPAGFVVGDYFSFEDENMKEVICMLTDNEGMHDWDIDMPVTEDGKKTIYLMAVDMVENVSTAITYDFYIDATAPKPVVKDEKSGTVLMADSAMTYFSKEMTLYVSLEKMHMEGLTEPDQFTLLKLMNGQGDELTNLLEYNDGTNQYSYKMKDYGDYTLQLAAKDSVGNTTGIYTYRYSFTADKTAAENALKATGAEPIINSQSNAQTVLTDTVETAQSADHIPFVVAGIAAAGAVGGAVTSLLLVRGKGK